MRSFRTVALLLLFVCFSREALSDEGAPDTKPLSDYFPSDAILYIECPSVPKFVEGLRKTGPFSLWNDAEMEPIRTWFEQAMTGNLQVRDNIEIMRSIRDYAASLPGGLALALTKGDSGAGYLVVAELGPDPSGARAILNRIYAREQIEGYPPRRVELSGVSVTVSGVDGECTAITNNVLLIGSRPAMEFVLASLRADSNEQSLTNSVAFTKAMSFLSASSAFRAFVDVSGLLALAKAPRVAAIVSAAKKYVDQIDTVSLEGVFARNGVLERVFISTKSADSELISLAGRGIFDDSRLSLVPRDVFLCAGCASDLGLSPAGWANLQEPLKSVIERLETISDVSIRRDILPCLGPTSLMYLTVPDKPVSPTSVDFVMLVETSDEAKLSESLDRLTAAARDNPVILNPQANSPSVDVFSVETATLGTLRIYYLSIKGAPFLTPAVTVYRGYLVFASSKETAKAVVDNIIAPGPGIPENEDFARVRGVLPKQVNQVFYLSVDRLVDLLYDAIFPMVASSIDAARANGVVSFASSDVPPAFVIKKHLDGIAMSLAAAGNLIEVNVYSPTGIVPMAAMAISVAGAKSAAAGLRPRPDAVPASASRERLLQIGRKLQLSTIDHGGKFPDALADVLAPGFLQAPQDPVPDSPVDYVYVKGLSASSPGKKILVYERDGLSTDSRLVLRVDGSVDSIPDNDLKTLLEK